MSERYTKLFSLPPDLYAQGSPLIVSAGNLLKDNQTGKVLAQLKIKNISPKAVRAATVTIHPLDTAGRPMDGETTYEYLDLSVRQGEEFGQKTAIPLPNPSTRGFTVEVAETIFEGNCTWIGTDSLWEPLPAAAALSSTLKDPELVRQYQLTFGGPCQVTPQEHKDLWQCACGAWNREDPCCACRKSRDVLFGLDLKSLTADKDARLVREKAAREAQAAAEKAAAEQAAAEAAARDKKTKKLLTILIPAAAVCLAAILLISQIILPNSNYKKAKALLDEGRFEEAIPVFEALNGYKDSAALLETAKSKAEQGRWVKAEPKPTEEPKPDKPTPDPADAIWEVFPFLNGFDEAEERLEVEAAECLRSYQMGGALQMGGATYANVFYGEDLDENLFATLCASYNKLLIEATSTMESKAEEGGTTETGDGATDTNTETDNGAQNTEQSDEASGSSTEPDELTTTVVAAIRGEGNYLCVFFAKQKEAISIRYDRLLSYINTALGVSPDEIALYLTVFPQDDELIGRYNANKTLYPIQASLVPEYMAHRYDSFIEENGYRAVWLCDFEFARFVLYIVDSGAVEAAEFEAKMEEAKDIFDPSLVYMGAKEGRNYALIFPMVDNNDAWFESEPWYVNATQAYGWRPVQ